MLINFTPVFLQREFSLHDLKYKDHGTTIVEDLSFLLNLFSEIASFHSSTPMACAVAVVLR